MQEAILTNVIHFAPIGILALLLIMVLILGANLRQTKKINKKLTDTLQKADDYFQYILEEEEAEETENEKTLTSEPVKKDPRKGFMKLLKEGSVPLIMGEKKVSDLPINIVYGKKDTTKQSAWNFMNRKDVEKELDEFEKTASTDSFASELPAVLYATKYLHFLTDTTK